MITGRDEVKLHNFADAVDRDKVKRFELDISDCTVIEEKNSKQVLNELAKLIFGLIMPEYIGMLITVAGYWIGMR